MSIPILLHIVEQPSGGWMVSLGRPSQHRTTAFLGPDDVVEIMDAAAQVDDAEQWPHIVVPGEDATWRALEEGAGRALGRVLSAAPALGRVLARAQGEADGANKQLTMGVDLGDPALASLPWELLASGPDGAGLEPASGGLVVRLAPGGARALRDAPIQPLVWSLPGGADDDCVAPVLAHLRHRILEEGLPEPADALAATVDKHRCPVLFVVMHGDLVGELLALVDGASGAVGGGTLAQALGRVMEHCAAVVLLVCDGGYRPARWGDGLVPRVLERGARVCVAPTGHLPVPTAKAFVDGFVHALARGRSIGHAVREGRGRISARHDAAPAARWWRMQVAVSDLHALRWKGRPGIPPGWQPGKGALRLVQDAVDRAAELGHDWLGIEHIVLALRPRDLTGRRLRALHTWRGELKARLGTWVVEDERNPIATRRLERAVMELPPGFEIHHLVEAIQGTLPWRFRQAVDLEWGSDSSYTITLDSSILDEGSFDPDVGGPWDTFEVLGGPDDGRRILVRPGQRLGRRSSKPKADVQLFERSRCFASGVSRLHLEVLDGGRVAAHRKCPAQLSADRTHPLACGEEVTLQAGDIVQLSAGVALCARNGSASSLG